MQSRVTPKPLGVPGGVSVINNNLEDRGVKESSAAKLVRFYNLFNGVAQGMMQREGRVVRFDFCQVAVVANMISDPVVFQILVLLRSPRMSFANLECLQNGATIVLAPAQIINFTRTGRLYE
jgi:hypothetical protein